MILAHVETLAPTQRCECRGLRLRVLTSFPVSTLGSTFQSCRVRDSDVILGLAIYLLLTPVYWVHLLILHVEACSITPEYTTLASFLDLPHAYYMLTWCTLRSSTRQICAGWSIFCWEICCGTSMVVHQLWCILEWLNITLNEHELYSPSVLKQRQQHLRVFRVKVGPLSLLGLGWLKQRCQVLQFKGSSYYFSHHATLWHLDGTIFLKIV